MRKGKLPDLTTSILVTDFFKTWALPLQKCWAITQDQCISSWDTWSIEINQDQSWSNSYSSFVHFWNVNSVYQLHLICMRTDGDLGMTRPYRHSLFHTTESPSFKENAYFSMFSILTGVPHWVVCRYMHTQAPPGTLQFIKMPCDENLEEGKPTVPVSIQ